MGGVGTSSVAVLCAAATAEEGRPTVLVDLSGDAAAMMGVNAEPVTPTALETGAASLADCVVGCGENLALLHADVDAGRSPAADGLRSVFSALSGHDTFVVVDAGTGPAAAGLLANAPVDVVAVTSSSFSSLTRWADLEGKAERVVLCANGRLGVGEHNARDYLGRDPDVVLGDDPLIARMADAGNLALHGREQPRRFAAVAESGAHWEPPAIA